MSIWLQHGFGKGDKLRRLIADQALDGVILSPADEPPEGLAAIVAEANAAKVECWLDPQTYVYTISQGVGRCHALHGLKFHQLEWSVDPDSIAKMAKAVVKANQKIGTEVVVSPAPLQKTFSDKWAPLGLQFARVVARQFGAEATIASVVLHESALDHWKDVEDWLDSVTRLAIRGFYVVVARTAGSDYPAAWDKERLTNLYRLVYRLRVLNEYEVVLGYSDVDGLGAVAVGAGMGSGWFHSQRRFQEAKWKPSTGGAPAQPRFLSNRLLVPLRADEARSLIDAGEDKWVAATTVDRAPLKGLYTIADARIQHLRTLASLAAEVGSVPVAQRPALLQRKLLTARQQLERLGHGQLARGLTYANQLSAISVALDNLRMAEGLGSSP